MICTTIVLLLLIGTAIGLGVTTVYGYLDPKTHYQTKTCYINNCTSSEYQCRGSFGRTWTCYDTTVNYDLILPNITNNTDNTNETIIYSQTSIGYGLRLNDCDQITITCYYDDRDIQNTLRTWYTYDSGFGLYGVIMLAIFLGIITFISSIFVPMIWLESESDANTGKNNNNDINFNVNDNDNNKIIDLSESKGSLQ